MQEGGSGGTGIVGKRMTPGSKRGLLSLGCYPRNIDSLCQLPIRPPTHDTLIPNSALVRLLLDAELP